MLDDVDPIDGASAWSVACLLPERTPMTDVDIQHADTEPVPPVPRA
jgi:hypothetical protein